MDGPSANTPAPNYSGPTTTANSGKEGRLMVDANSGGLGSKKKRKIVKTVVKKVNGKGGLIDDIGGTVGNAIKWGASQVGKAAKGVSAWLKKGPRNEGDPVAPPGAKYHWDPTNRVWVGGEVPQGKPLFKRSLTKNNKMSLINTMQNLKNLKGSAEQANVADDEITGAKNAIRNFVEAKKGEANAENKGKSGVIKKLLKNKAKAVKK